MRLSTLTKGEQKKKHDEISCKIMLDKLDKIIKRNMIDFFRKNIKDMLWLKRSLKMLE